MKNWKIGTRIAAGFEAVIAIAVALGLFAYSAVGAIGLRSAMVKDDALPSVYIMVQIHTNAERVMRTVLEHVIAIDKQQKTTLETHLQQIRTETGGLLARYEKELISDEKDREILAQLAGVRASFWASVEAVLKLSRVGTAASNQQAADLLQAQLTPVYAKYAE